MRPELNLLLSFVAAAIHCAAFTVFIKVTKTPNYSLSLRMEQNETLRAGAQNVNVILKAD